MRKYLTAAILAAGTILAIAGPAAAGSTWS